MNHSVREHVWHTFIDFAVNRFQVSQAIRNSALNELTSNGTCKCHCNTTEHESPLNLPAPLLLLFLSLLFVLYSIFVGNPFPAEAILAVTVASTVKHIEALTVVPAAFSFQDPPQWAEQTPQLHQWPSASFPVHLPRCPCMPRRKLELD